MSARRLLAAALCSTALFAGPATAYVYCGFLDRMIHMRAYFSNSDFWVDMLAAEELKWNHIHPALAIDRTRSSTVPGGKDGNNIIAWIAEADLNSIYNATWTDGSVGLTVTWYDHACGRIVEEDMLFNPGISLFTPQMTVPYSLGFQEIALHELGHSITLDHEDRALAVMTTNNAVSDVLHSDDKVGWIRSAAQKFNPLPTPINDMGVFPLRNASGAKVYSTLAPTSVARGANVTIRDFTVENLSALFSFRNPVFRVVLEDVGSEAVFVIGTFFWDTFPPFASWSGKLTFTVPASVVPAKYRVVAIFNGNDDDKTNDRAVFGTVAVF